MIPTPSRHREDVMIARLVAAFLSLLLLSPGVVRAEGPRELSRGETVYVPVYSNVWHGNLDGSGKPEMMLLSTMLSIRNVDPDRSITVRSVRYYDTDGNLLLEYYAEPKVLRPLQSTDVFVEHRDKAGGSGANFLVVWDAETPANPPLIESLSTYFFGTRSVVFTSPGRPILTGGN
jgi:hypothetical protein